MQRYLHHEAVDACPPSKLYRFRTFARRNRVALASTLLVVASLVVGAGVATWQSVLAIRERDNTEAARVESEKLATLGLEVLDDIYLNVLGDRLVREQEVSAEQRQLLQAGLDYYEQFVAQTRGRSDSDLVIGNAQRQVGLIYGRLGDLEREGTAYRRAIALYEQHAAQSPYDPEVDFRVALVLGSLLENQAALGQHEQSRQSGDRAIAMLERLREQYPEQSEYGMALAGMHNRLAWALAPVLSAADVERHYRTALALFGQLARDFPHARLAGELPYDDPLDGLAHTRLLLANALGETEGTEEIDELRRAALQHFEAKTTSNPRSQWHRATGRNQPDLARRRCAPRSRLARGTAQ